MQSIVRSGDDDDVSFYNSTASTGTLATPRTTWESNVTLKISYVDHVISYLSSFPTVSSAAFHSSAPPTSSECIIGQVTLKMSYVDHIKSCIYKSCIYIIIPNGILCFVLTCAPPTRNQ